MANVDAKRGARLVGNLRGAGDAMVHTYYVPASVATAMFVGDFVKSGGSADPAGQYPSIDLAAATDVIRGVIIGFEPVWGVPSVNFKAASVAGYVRVCDDPDAVYAIQEDSVGGALTATEVGENADIVVAAGSTVFGYSGHMLDSSTHTASSAQLRILGINPLPNNALGTTAEILVLINKHELKQTSGV